MRFVAVMAILAWLLMSAAACKKDNKAEQLAALDAAYQSGVLSKAEYDSKRLALVGASTADKPIAIPKNPPMAAAPALPSEQPKPAGQKPDPTAPPSQAVSPRRTLAAENAVKPAIVAQPPPIASTREPEPAVAQSQPERQPAPAAGCEDLDSSAGKVKGPQQRFYAASIEAVKKAAGIALNKLDFNIRDDAGDEWEASKRRHIGVLVGAGGERVMLQFEKAHRGNQSGTRVTADTKKSLMGRMAQKSWTNAVLSQIDCQLRSNR